MLAAGESTDTTGGSVSLMSGFGTAKSSGAFSVLSADAGTGGVSGSLSFKTGTTTSGSSGSIEELRRVAQELAGLPVSRARAAQLALLNRTKARGSRGR